MVPSFGASLQRSHNSTPPYRRPRRIGPAAYCWQGNTWGDVHGKRDVLWPVECTLAALIASDEALAKQVVFLVSKASGRDVRLCLSAQQA